MKKLILIAALLASSSSWGDDCISGNCINGIGTYTWDSGNKYVGEHQDDKRHGQGTATFANGPKYVGEYQDDKYHGQGTYTFKNGTKQTGFFLNGSFVPYLCQEMGLTKGTDAFGQCVVQLINEVNK